MPIDDGSLRAAGESSVVVVGLVRNCERQLAADFSQLKNAFNVFREVKWLLIESDSDDASASLLDRLSQSESDFRFVSLGRLVAKFPLRTQRIAYCRNVYLEELRNNPSYANADYVAVADFDGVNSLLSSQGIVSCWRRRDWDVCTANQLGPYYDIWALRHEDWSPNDCWKQSRFLARFDPDLEAVRFAAAFARMVTVPPSSDWIEVDSAFGGLALYRRDVIIQSSYVGLTEQGEQICEHVPFHLALRKRGFRIFINPALTNAAENEHSRLRRSAPHARGIAWYIKQSARKLKKRLSRNS